MEIYEKMEKANLSFSRWGQLLLWPLSRRRKKGRLDWGRKGEGWRRGRRMRRRWRRRRRR